MKFEIYPDKGGRYRWRVTAKNGEIVGASSQGFATRQGAETNAILLRDGLLFADRLGIEADS